MSDCLAHSSRRQRHPNSGHEQPRDNYRNLLSVREHQSDGYGESPNHYQREATHDAECGSIASSLRFRLRFAEVDTDNHGPTTYHGNGSAPRIPTMSSNEGTGFRWGGAA
jgi:hypothetical protein